MGEAVAVETATIVAVRDTCHENAQMVEVVDNAEEAAKEEVVVVVAPVTSAESLDTLHVNAQLGEVEVVVTVMSNVIAAEASATWHENALLLMMNRSLVAIVISLVTTMDKQEIRRDLTLLMSNGHTRSMMYISGIMNLDRSLVT